MDERKKKKKIEAHVRQCYNAFVLDIDGKSSNRNSS